MLRRWARARGGKNDGCAACLGHYIISSSSSSLFLSCSEWKWCRGEREGGRGALGGVDRPPGTTYIVHSTPPLPPLIELPSLSRPRGLFRPMQRMGCVCLRVLALAPPASACMCVRISGAFFFPSAAARLPSSFFPYANDPSSCRAGLKSLRWTVFSTSSFGGSSWKSR